MISPFRLPLPLIHRPPLLSFPKLTSLPLLFPYPIATNPSSVAVLSSMINEWHQYAKKLAKSLEVANSIMLTSYPQEEVSIRSEISKALASMVLLDEAHDVLQLIIKCLDTATTKSRQVVPLMLLNKNMANLSEVSDIKKEASKLLLDNLKTYSSAWLEFIGKVEVIFNMMHPVCDQLV